MSQEIPKAQLGWIFLAKTLKLHCPRSGFHLFPCNQDCLGVTQTGKTPFNGEKPRSGPDPSGGDPPVDGIGGELGCYISLLSF